MLHASLFCESIIMVIASLAFRLHNKLLEFHDLSDFLISRKGDFESAHKQPSTSLSFSYFSLHSVRWTFSPRESSDSEPDPRCRRCHNIVDSKASWMSQRKHVYKKILNKKNKKNTYNIVDSKAWMSQRKHVYTCNVSCMQHLSHRFQWTKSTSKPDAGQT